MQFRFENVEQRCGYLLTWGLWSDCTFMVGSETNQAVIQAHKLVLAMASPVFEAMFYGGLSENNVPTIHIPDVQPDAFRAMLQYIYTANLNIESFDMASNLWYGAEKYMLPHLVTKCSSYIYSVVSPRNVCRAYEVASCFEEKTLMDICIQIISTNTKEVLSDKSFEDVELSTVLTVCSLNHLNVDSELDLFNAVARYAQAEKQRQEQFCPLEDGGQPSEMLSQSVGLTKVLLNVESSSLTSPAAEQDSKTTSGVVIPKPTTSKENLKAPEKEKRPAHAGIRAALEKIRFLSLTAIQFAEGPGRSGLLTKAETFAVLMNIASHCDVPMPNGFSKVRERRQLRSDSTQVDEGPIAKPRMKPGTESPSAGASTKLPTPAEIVRGLLSRKIWKLEQAARAARRMTSENLTQLVAAGGIPPLVAALHHPRTGVQYDAAWAITNIACHGEHATALVTAGAVPALVGLLDRGGTVAEQAAWALGNITGARNTVRGAVVDAGAGPALLSHIQHCTPTASLATYLRTYRILCQSRCYSSDNKSMYKLKPIMLYIKNLLALADEQILAEACYVLYHLVRQLYIDLELFTPSLAAQLTALMGHATPRVYTAALLAVGAILNSTDLRNRCVGAGCLDHLINFLKCGNPSHVERAAMAVGQVLSTPRHRAEALEKGILDALGTALTKGFNECKLTVSRAYGIFCNSSTEEQISMLAQKLVDSDALLAQFCRLLVPADNSEGSLVGCGNTLSSICGLLTKTDDNTQHSLVLRMQEVGVPRLLIRLLQNNNQWNRKTAAFLLNTYFPDEQRCA